MNSIEGMQAESTITAFINFFEAAIEDLGKQPGGEELTPEDAKTIVTMMRMMKTFFVAQLAAKELLKDAGYELDDD